MRLWSLVVVVVCVCLKRRQRERERGWERIVCERAVREYCLLAAAVAVVPVASKAGISIRAAARIAYHKFASSNSRTQLSFTTLYPGMLTLTGEPVTGITGKKAD